MQTGRFGAVGVGLAAADCCWAEGHLGMRHPWRDMSHSLDRIPAISRFRRWYTTHFGEFTAELLDRLGRRGGCGGALPAGLLGVMVLAVGFAACSTTRSKVTAWPRSTGPRRAGSYHREGWLNTSLTVLTHLGDQRRRPSG